MRWLRPGCLGLFRKVGEGETSTRRTGLGRYAKAPYTVLRRAMHIHPTVSELIPTMLGELKPL